MELETYMHTYRENALYGSEGPSFSWANMGLQYFSLSGASPKAKRQTKKQGSEDLFGPAKPGPSDPQYQQAEETDPEKVLRICQKYLTQPYAGCKVLHVKHF